MYQIYKKWGNNKTINVGGYQYDSKFEGSYAQELILREKTRDIKSWERQVNLRLIVNGYEVCTYRIDFIIHHNDGTLEYVETKGYPTDVWKLKWKLFEALYSDIPGNKLTIVQQGRFKPPKAKRVR